MEKLTDEQIQELFEFLAEGKLPRDAQTYRMEPRPRLGKKKALAIIWFLQERIGIIPDNFELDSPVI